MLFFLSTAVSHDGSGPVQQVEANPLKRPALVTLEGVVAPLVKQKRKSPIKKAGKGAFIHANPSIF